jgi:hypothetical protein
MTVQMSRQPGPTLRPGVAAVRQRRARRMAYLGCAGALGYGVMKVVWALGGPVGVSDPAQFHATENGLPAPQRFFHYWGTPILAGVAVVILLGLAYPWGNAVILRPLLRTLAWAGSLVGVAGLAGLILKIQYFAGDLGRDRLGNLDPRTYLFTYACFLAVCVGFGVTAWLTRRRGEASA